MGGGYGAVSDPAIVPGENRAGVCVPIGPVSDRLGFEPTAEFESALEERCECRRIDAPKVDLLQVSVLSQPVDMSVARWSQHQRHDDAAGSELLTESEEPVDEPRFDGVGGGAVFRPAETVYEQSLAGRIGSPAEPGRLGELFPGLAAERGLEPPGSEEGGTGNLSVDLDDDGTDVGRGAAADPIRSSIRARGLSPSRGSGERLDGDAVRVARATDGRPTGPRPREWSD